MAEIVDLHPDREPLKTGGGDRFNNGPLLAPRSAGLEAGRRLALHDATGAVGKRSSDEHLG